MGLEGMAAAATASSVLRRDPEIRIAANLDEAREAVNRILREKQPRLKSSAKFNIPSEVSYAFGEQSCHHHRRGRGS
jgi:hypothetical protein